MSSRKKRPGRPAEGNTARLGIAVTPALLRLLDRYCKRYKMNRNQFARKAFERLLHERPDAIAYSGGDTDGDGDVAK